MSFANPENISGIVDLMEYNNSVTDDWAGFFIPIVVWVCAFGLTSRYSTEHASTTASFITFLASSMLVITGLVSPTAIFVSFGLTVISYVVSKV